jgi:hypothetical protein
MVTGFALDTEKRAKLIEARGKVRAAIIQVIGGIVVVAAFVTTIQQIHSSDDAFNQEKADLAGWQMSAFQK